uniref:Uncharacterized protein n=1 Tax=Panagrellus redivivus TaxID=6233 RepID=A0A7E4W6K8_PANRE
MGCFANFFRYIYAFLALIAIFIMILILTLPTYWSYCGDTKCNLQFYMNPSHAFCIHNSNFLCPPEYRTSNTHRVIWIIYILIIPIILVCAILNFVTALLCCPFGPKGVTTATGLSAFLCFICIFMSMLSFGTKKVSYVGITNRPGPTAYIAIIEFILLVSMTVLSSFVSFLSKLCL